MTLIFFFHFKNFTVKIKYFSAAVEKRRDKWVGEEDSSCCIEFIIVIHSLNDSSSEANI